MPFDAAGTRFIQFLHFDAGSVNLGHLRFGAEHDDQVHGFHRVLGQELGTFGSDVDALCEQADAVVVPVLPSALDIDATVGFLNTLAKHPAVRRGQTRVGLVANRLRPWTNASQQAVTLLEQWPYPVVAQLRDSQAYVMLVGLGRSLFDYHSAQVRDHQSDWAPLLKWLRK